MEDFLDIANKSQTVIKFDNMEFIDKDQTAEIAKKIDLKKKKQLSTAVSVSKPVQHRNKMNWNRSQHISNPN